MENLIVDTIPDQASFVMPIVGWSMYNEETGQIKSDSIAFINPKFEETALNNKVVIVNFHGEIICKRYINKDKYILFNQIIYNLKLKIENLQMIQIVKL